MKKPNTLKSKKKYYAKLLLFGEYAVIRGASALAIPYPSFYGQWKTSTTPNPSNTTLAKLGSFLAAQDGLAPYLDVKHFRTDVANGLYFDSSIPEGYGMGSSGALCAAIYDRYAIGTKKTTFDDLRAIFQLLEAYFHGKGSGLDPLVCYLNQPILTKGDEIKEQKLPQFEGAGTVLFLLDTRIQRQTAPLVKLFNEKCLNKNYLNKIDSQLVISNNNGIKAFLNSNKAVLLENWKQISDFQYYHFKEMIPNALQTQWLNGLEDGIYSLKLCGAGGGGYLLGITNDFNLTKSVLLGFDLTNLHEL